MKQWRKEGLGRKNKFNHIDFSKFQSGLLLVLIKRAGDNFKFPGNRVRNEN